MAPGKKKTVFAIILGVLVGTPVIVVLLFFGSLAYWRWDSDHNRGHHHGYWGEFNRITDALTSLPGVTIEKSWANEDVTLEEFGFTIQVSSQAVSLEFGETDPIRGMKGKQLSEALSRKIEERKSTQPAH